MLDMGFAEDLEAILAATPAEKQTALFSATLPPRIAAIARAHLKDPVTIRIDRAVPAGRHAGAGAAGGVRRGARAQAGGARPRARRRAPGVGHRVLPHAHRGRRARRDADRARLPRRGAARRAVAGPARPRDADASAAASPTCSSPPTSPRAGSTSSTSRTWSTTTCRWRPRRTSTASAAPGARGATGVAITLAEPREHRMLRNIERVTRQRIEIAPVPTVADLRARRDEVLRAGLRETILAGDLDRHRAHRRVARRGVRRHGRRRRGGEARRLARRTPARSTRFPRRLRGPNGRRTPRAARLRERTAAATPTRGAATRGARQALDRRRTRLPDHARRPRRRDRQRGRRQWTRHRARSASSSATAPSRCRRRSPTASSPRCAGRTSRASA